MSFTLRLMSGAESVSLNGDVEAGDLASVVAGFVPRPAKAEQWASDTIPLIMPADTWRSTLNRINSLLELATAYHEDNRGSPVYLCIQTDEDSQEWRSEVRKGEGRPGPLALDSQWSRNYVLVNVIVERTFWETVDEIQLLLSNGNGTEQESITVWNHDDGTATISAGMWTGWGVMTYPVSMSVGGGHDNWAVVHTADLEGDLPAPLRLVMENINDHTVDAVINRVYVGRDSLNRPELPTTLEGEDASDGANLTADSSPSSTYASGGAYRSVTWTASTEAELLQFVLSTEMLDAAQTRNFRLFLRFFSDAATAPPAYTDLSVRFKILNNVGAVLAASEWKRVTAGQALLDVATLQLPPFSVHLPGGYASLSLRLYAKRAGGGTLGIDAVHIMPTDSYRKLEPLAYGLAWPRRLVDDEMAGVVYTDLDSEGSKRRVYTARGKPLMVTPGSNSERLAFLFDVYSGQDAWVFRNGDAPIAERLQVSAFVRERRSTI